MGIIQKKIGDSIKSWYDWFQNLMLKHYWQFRSRHTSFEAVTLMFHDIQEDPQNEMKYNCDPRKFENILLRYREKGYSFISIPELFEVSSKSIKDRFVIVTFDDIFDNVYLKAFPILKKNNVPFTVFITPSFIDKPGYVSKEHLLEMADHSLCTVGAHTMTHPKLSIVSYSFEEMKQSKLKLEELLNKEVRYLAYPYGKRAAVSKRNEKEAASIGFEAAFGTIETAITDYTIKKKYYLPRMVGERVII